MTVLLIDLGLLSAPGLHSTFLVSRSTWMALSLTLVSSHTTASDYALIDETPETYGNIFEIRPAGEMSEIVKASEQRRRQFIAS
jgi:hypothetical protein